MTTWDEPCYKTDFISTLSRWMSKDEKQIKYVLDTFPLEINNFDGCPMKTKEELYQPRIFGLLFPKLSLNKNTLAFNSFVEISRRAQHHHTGLSAVYKIARAYYENEIEYHNEIDFRWLNKVQEKVDTFDMFASLLTPKNIAKTVDSIKLPKKSQTAYTILMQSSYTIIHLAYHWRANSMQDLVRKRRRANEPYPYVTPSSVTGVKPGKIEIYTFPGLLIYSIKSHLDDTVHNYYLTAKDVRRVSQLLRSLAKLYQYFHLMSVQQNYSGIDDSADKYMREMITIAAKTERPNEVARAFDVIFFYNVSLLANDIWNRSTEDQMKKWKEFNYEQIVSLEYVTSIASKHQAMERLDILKIYKILPCPDFCPFTGFMNMKNHHGNRNTFGKIPEEFKDLDLKISVEEFEKYRKMMYIHRYYKRHEMLPGRLYKFYDDNPDELGLKKKALEHYPNIPIDNITLETVEFIDIKGTMAWEVSENNLPSGYADKACPPQDTDLNTIEDSYQYNSLPLRQRSFLMWYLSQSDVPNGEKLRQEFLRKNLQNQQTAHFKPESKKPDPRNFYSAKPLFRKMHSEFEENVRRYMANDVASYIGKNPTDQSMAIKAILGMEADRERGSNFDISFDLQRFSPNYNQDAKILSYKIWEEVCPQPHITAIRESYKETELHFIHEGIHQKYTTSYPDLEGQSGTVNTAFHIDVMAYAVRKIREMKITKHPGRLAVMIDDGLLSLRMPEKHNTETIIRAIRIIDATYQYFGFKISWDKTFVSRDFAMFLNEMYYKGENITTGVKAFLKMQPTKLEDELSISAKIKGLSSMAMGCIQTGLPPTLSKSELHREILILISRNMKTMSEYKLFSPDALPYFMFAPVAFGGLGIPHMTHITSSPHADPIGSYLGTAWRMAQTMPSTAPVYQKILTQPIRTRRPIDILRGPDSLRITTRTLTESKHIQYVLEMVRSLSENRLIKPFLHIDMPKLADEIFKTIGANAEAIDISSTYGSSPLAVIDNFLGKFKRSSTLMGMLRPRLRTRLIARYVTELRTVTKNFHEIVINL